MDAESMVKEIVISASGLRKSFGEIEAVKGIDFEVNKGEIFALLGPNGAGKTTTVSILEGILKRDSGRISILGMDPWSEHTSLKSRIGVMPQEFNFFEKLTPRDSLRFYCQLFKSNSNPMDLLKLVLLEDSADKPFDKLSGGQKQKLGLALSLVSNPEVLFLDEPTTGLDPAARRAIWDIILKFKEQGKTIVLTTHYMEEAERLSDRIAIVNRGEVVIAGTPGQIVADHGSGRRLVIKTNSDLAGYLSENSVTFRKRNHEIEIPLVKNASVADLVSLIEESGIEYSELTVTNDRLEDIFIRLVGEMTEGELR